MGKYTVSEAVLKQRRANSKKAAKAKKGTKAAKTILKATEAKVLSEVLRERTLSHYIPALERNALGKTFVYKFSNIESDEKGKAILVTDPQEIAQALPIIVEAGGDGGISTNGTFYFITTKEPETQALKELLDRAFGKAPQKIGFDEEGSTGFLQALAELAKQKKSNANE